MNPYYIMNKIFDFLAADGCINIDITDNIITGNKNEAIKKCKIATEFVDVSDDIEYIFIPYEDNFLIYKINQVIK